MDLYDILFSDYVNIQVHTNKMLSYVTVISENNTYVLAVLQIAINKDVSPTAATITLGSECSR